MYWGTFSISVGQLDLFSSEVSVSFMVPEVVSDLQRTQRDPGHSSRHISVATDSYAQNLDVGGTDLYLQHPCASFVN